MIRKLVTVPACVLAAAGILSADFTYRESSRLPAREALVATIAVKRDRLLRKSSTQAQLIDLQAETLTRIDLQKKTYTVVPFSALQPATVGPQPRFHVSSHATGNIRLIEGFDAREMVVRITQDASPIVVTARVWIAAHVPGFGEVREFHRRLLEKLPSYTPTLDHPEAASAIAELHKEIVRLDGAPLLQTIAIVGESRAAAPSPKPTLGSALSGRFKTGNKRSPAAAEPPPGNLTVDAAGFSTAGLDGAMFEIPARFRQVRQARPKR